MSQNFHLLLLQPGVTVVWYVYIHLSITGIWPFSQYRHIPTVVEQTNGPRSHTFTLSKERSNPIASYCLHLSPVLSSLEVIGSPLEMLFIYLFILFGNVTEAPLGSTYRSTYRQIICYLWLKHIGLLIPGESECVFVAVQRSTFVWWNPTCRQSVTAGRERERHVHLWS